MNPAELKMLRLLGDLSEEALEAIGEELEELRLEPGTRIFSAGDPGDGLVLIAEGEVLLLDAQRAESDTYGAGDALGSLSLAVVGPREATAETTSRTRALVLRRSAFRRLASATPHAACELLEAILREHAGVLRQVMTARARETAVNEG